MVRFHWPVAAALLVVAHPAVAEPSPGLGEVALAPAEPGARGYVVLASGQTHLGKVVRAKPGVVAIRLENDAVEFARTAEVRGVLDASVPFGSLPRGPRPSFAVLRDGRVVRGLVVERTGDGLVLEVGPGVRRSFAGDDVTRVIPVSEQSRIADGVDRHLTAPSALVVPRGDVRLALVQGSDLSATVGVLEHVALSVGTSVPVLHADGFGANVFASARAGLALGAVFHLAAGVHLRAGSAGSVEGFLSATATARLPAVQLTVHAGPMFEGARGLGDYGSTGVALGATARVGRRLDIVAEVWGSRVDGETASFLASALRWHVWRALLDLGVARPSQGELAPWIGLQLDATR